jgi:hypothetical protein
MLSFTIKSIILIVIMLSGVSFMLSIKIKCIMLSVTMLNVTTLYVVILSVKIKSIMLSITMLNVTTLYAVLLNALAPLNYGRKKICCAGPG